MNYELIKNEPGALEIRNRCRVAQVSSSGYYAWKNQVQEQQKSDTELLKQIESILEEFPGYGYRRVTKELQKQGLKVNKKRIQRVMQDRGLQRKRRRRFVRTTDSKHGLPVYPNLIRDVVVERPNQVWAADITYVRLVRGFVFVAVLLDLFSRKVIGWGLSTSLHAELAVNALTMALQTRDVQAGLIHHSDRGVQYACEAYVEILLKHGITISMSRKANPYDNAKLESFMKTLKIEEVYLNEYETEEDANTNIKKFIETLYNKKRLHSSLGYCSPVEFEDNFHSQKAA
jgi:transposase InsO family protein